MARNGYPNYPPQPSPRADYGRDSYNHGPPDYDDRGPELRRSPQWGRIPHSDLNRPQEYDAGRGPHQESRQWQDDRDRNGWGRAAPSDGWRQDYPPPDRWNGPPQADSYWEQRDRERPPVSPNSRPDYDTYSRPPLEPYARDARWDARDDRDARDRDDMYASGSGWGGDRDRDVSLRDAGDYLPRDYPQAPSYPMHDTRPPTRFNAHQGYTRGRGRGRLRAITNYKKRSFGGEREFSQQRQMDMGEPAASGSRLPEQRYTRSRSRSQSRSRSRSRSRSDRGEGPSRRSRSGSESRLQEAEPTAVVATGQRSRSGSVQSSSIGSSRPPSRGQSPSRPADPDAPRGRSPPRTANRIAVNTTGSQQRREVSPVPGLGSPQAYLNPSLPGPSHTTNGQSRTAAASGSQDVTMSERPAPSATFGSAQSQPSGQAAEAPRPVAGRQGGTFPQTSNGKGKGRAMTPPTPPATDNVDAVRTREAEEGIQYLQLGREPYLPYADDDPYEDDTHANLFPTDDSAFWRANNSNGPFLGTLHASVKLMHDLPRDVMRTRIESVLKTNRAVLDEPSNRVVFDDSDGDGGSADDEEAEDIIAQHRRLLPIFRGRVGEQQIAQHHKIEVLRNEYRRLHIEWARSCAALDKLKNLPPEKGGPPDPPTHIGRNTRRNTTLGAAGDAVRTEFEMEQIMASLGNEDLTDPNQLYQRNVATIPDMVSLQPDFFEYQYDDTNGFVEDPHTFYDELSGDLSHWTEEEEEIFKQKFAENPKQFGAIAAALPNKTPEECVIFYYMTKKTRIDFRKVLQTYGSRRRRGRKLAGNKGGALLADIQKTRRKVSPPPLAPPANTASIAAPAPVQETRRGGRPRTSTAKSAAALDESEEESQEPTPPPKKNKGGRPSNAARAAAAAAAAALAASGETPPASERKKPGPRPKTIDTSAKKKTVSSYWSVGERSLFLNLLAQHGKDFQKIADSMPEKSLTQVGNYFKAHSESLGLEGVAAQSAAAAPPPVYAQMNGVTYQIVPGPPYPVPWPPSASESASPPVAGPSNGR